VFAANVLPQPEGLTFLPNGDLLVASEGRGGPPVVLRFAYASAPAADGGHRSGNGRK
jgi:hypothetical protein